MGMGLGTKWEPDVHGLQSNGETGKGRVQPAASLTSGWTVQLALPLEAELRECTVSPQPRVIRPV